MSTPYYQDEHVTLWHGDAIEVLAQLPDASVDSVVTDPPYGLEFMGKSWDRFDEDSRARAGMSGTGYTDGAERLERPSFLGGLNPKCRSCGKWQRGGNPCSCDSPNFPNERRARSAAFGDWCEAWTAECLRVLKPGGHLLAFGGTRTWHRLTCAVEDVGFEVRGSIAWLYGSGFPKSLDVSKAIDKAVGAERELVTVPNIALPSGQARYLETPGHRQSAVTGGPTPATPDAERWQGWGTALKPAFEPIVVARKPLAGTVAGNVLAHGTGALNIAACRVETDQPRPARVPAGRNGAVYGAGLEGGTKAPDTTAGRWPTNVVLDDTQAAALDQQSGERPSGAWDGNRNVPKFGNGGVYNDLEGAPERGKQADTGGASRFFPTFRYEAKAPTSERPRVNGTAHPTVKPLDLMRWLVRLVTPPGGTVLEPFAGSGTTVEACIVEGFHCIAIEREADYLPLIMQRVNRRRDPVAYIKAAGDELGLFDLEGLA